jgi:diguanylate cyclase (GGDEF)-like protein
MTTGGWEQKSVRAESSAPTDRALASERARADELALIATVARDLARTVDLGEARPAICSAAGLVCDANRIALLEPDPSGQYLEATASAGFDASGMRLSLGESSGAAMALRTNVARFASGGEGERVDAGEFPITGGIGSVLWQPVSHGRTVRGILALSWDRGIEAVGDSQGRLLEVVAVEAAVALDRGVAFGRLLGTARTDPLTDLPNRRACQDVLARERSRAAREGRPLSVAMIDLDDFRAYNEGRGHPAGDRLLEQAASAWQALIRASDTLARYGGDEFVLVLPNCDAASAARLLRRLTDAAVADVRFSAGVVAWDGREDQAELLDRADRALQRAKRDGSGTVVVPANGRGNLERVEMPRRSASGASDSVR